MDMRPKATKTCPPSSDPSLMAVNEILREVSKSSRGIIKIINNTSKNKTKRKTTKRIRLNPNYIPGMVYFLHDD
ncbi:hypothetical protein J437_LFUL017736 [Ladona fulva]|uniref:Uncharacterized protein n=1 Tax=Ladona fulva TaxID=123851 RepID=A0A8K0KFP8_LADFU|nr:hypothetical protein J437_LFUL017736 [Ladona fulva]